MLNSFSCRRARDADQQIDPAIYTLKPIEDLLRHFMVVEMQMQSDPEGLFAARSVRCVANDIKPPWSWGLPTIQIMRQGIASLGIVDVPRRFPGESRERLSEAECRWNTRLSSAGLDRVSADSGDR